MSQVAEWGISPCKEGDYCEVIGWQAAINRGMKNYLTFFISYLTRSYFIYDKYSDMSFPENMTKAAFTRTRNKPNFVRRVG